MSPWWSNGAKMRIIGILWDAGVCSGRALCLFRPRALIPRTVRKLKRQTGSSRQWHADRFGSSSAIPERIMTMTIQIVWDNSFLKKHKLFRKRAGIEPSIGHLKSDFRSGRNFYKGVVGDAVNVLLAAAAYNFKRAMKALLNLIRKIIERLCIYKISMKAAFKERLFREIPKEESVEQKFVSLLRRSILCTKIRDLQEITRKIAKYFHLFGDLLNKC